MKSPLRYQATEFDCGPAAVLNAVSFLYETDEIPPDFVKKIYEISLDDYNGNRAFHRGTSTNAMRFLAGWFNCYAERTQFPVRTEFYEAGEISLRDDSPILRCLRSGGAAVVRCILEVDHYVTLTGIEGRFVHVFDPYYMEKFPPQAGVIPVEGRPKEMNRKIDISVMDCREQCNYAFCSLKDRCALLFFRTSEEKVLLP